MKRRTLVQLVQGAPDARHQVWIDTTASGAVTFGVRTTGRSLKRAREHAEAQFQALREFVAKNGGK